MRPTASAISQLVARHDHESPIAVEDGLIFVFEGEVDSVSLAVAEDRFPRVAPMRRLRDTDRWYTYIDLEPDGAVEYRFATIVAGKRSFHLDANNPHRSYEPFGSNSVGLGPAYVAPGWLAGDARPGAVVPFLIRSRSWRRLRRHLLYLPPDFERDLSYPLLVMHDGPEFIEFAGLQTCLDAMIGLGSIPPVLALLHAPEARDEAYVDDPRHIVHVADEIIPKLRAEYMIGPVVAAGASLGAVASLSLAFRRPGLVYALMLQSGSFVTALGGRFKRGRVLEPVTRLIPEVLENPSRLPQLMVLSCGTYDGLVEDHRTLVPRLRDVVDEVDYSEINAGHHWRCWRDRLEPDLTAVLGGLSSA